ncbi:hypothetical protein SSX86_007791 [Deinandra increscens subsp. villosa]|uniref:Uncharacterized protein n=1 Tax=Deinandra increscens subsp. villosa TaxID=3103831 RepID=A0AAP0H6F7_9ASTR
MDGNMDEALRCLKIGKDALGLGDRSRALKFISKAQRLDPSLPVTDLLSNLETDHPADESPSKPAPNGAGDSSGVRRRVPIIFYSSLTPSGAQLCHYSELVGPSVEFEIVFLWGTGPTSPEVVEVPSVNVRMYPPDSERNSLLPAGEKAREASNAAERGIASAVMSAQKAHNYEGQSGGAAHLGQN